jgi:hypothetical protein
MRDIHLSPQISLQIERYLFLLRNGNSNSLYGYNVKQ